MRKSKLALLVALIISLAIFLSGCDPSNQKPNANFTANPTSGKAPLVVSFDAKNSSDRDGNIIGYTWGFGDGVTGSGKKPNHVYSSSGDFTVELTVTDDGGAQDSTTETIPVSSSDGVKRVKILDWQLTQDGDGDVLITETAKNITNETLAAAIVEGKLFNASNERVGTAMDAITFLDPGE